MLSFTGWISGLPSDTFKSGSQLPLFGLSAWVLRPMTTTTRSVCCFGVRYLFIDSISIITREMIFIYLSIIYHSDNWIAVCPLTIIHCFDFFCTKSDIFCLSLTWWLFLWSPYVNLWPLARRFLYQGMSPFLLLSGRQFWTPVQKCPTKHAFKDHFIRTRNKSRLRPEELMPNHFCYTWIWNSCSVALFPPGDAYTYENCALYPTSLNIFEAIKIDHR